VAVEKTAQSETSNERAPAKKNALAMRRSVIQMTIKKDLGTVIKFGIADTRAFIPNNIAR
jgi:hypothetical protein